MAHMEPLVRIGVIADVQYGDKEDNAFDDRALYYRDALPKLRRALHALVKGPLGPVHCLITLGDIIDGHKGDAVSTERDFQEVLKVLQQYDLRALGRHNGTPPYQQQQQGQVQHQEQHLEQHVEQPQRSQQQQHLQHPEQLRPQQQEAPEQQQQSKQQQGQEAEQQQQQALVPIYHTIGNHCLSVPREQLLAALLGTGPRNSSRSSSSSYYRRPLCPGWCLLVLDTTEMSPYSGLPQDSPAVQEAAAWQASHPIASWPRAEPWNGGCSNQQLSWLQQQLQEAAAEGAQALLTSHHPLAPGCAPDRYLAWNYEEILGVVGSYPGVVRVALAGHYHPGGYCHCEGVHHVTLEGLVEAPPESNAFAVFELWRDKVEIRGAGMVPNRTLSWQ